MKIDFVVAKLAEWITWSWWLVLGLAITLLILIFVFGAILLMVVLV